MIVQTTSGGTGEIRNAQQQALEQWRAGFKPMNRSCRPSRMNSVTFKLTAAMVLLAIVIYAMLR